MSISDTLSKLSKDILPTVGYAFTSAGTAGAHWHVRRFKARESLSETYRLEIELWTEDVEIHPRKLLGDSCSLKIERDGRGRHINGIIQNVEVLPTVLERTRMRVIAVPALQLLQYQRNTRSWQNKTALTIIADVLKPALAAYGRKFELRVNESAFCPREYCVQYRETDLEFAARIMHEEGLIYFFEHTDAGTEHLVLHDDTTIAKGLGIPRIPYVVGGKGVAAQQSIESLDWSCQLGTTSVVQRDWAWKEEAPTSFQQQRLGLDERNRDRQRYDHDDRLLPEDTATYARNKLEAERSGAESGHGSGDVVEMIPGRCFEVQYHPGLAPDDSYLLLSVTHTGEAPEVSQQSDQNADCQRYHNEFHCIRSKVPYHGPPPPPRQRVYGPQTAIVVGPDSSESADDIHTDDHGRIRVLFHWDRLWPRDEPASCWIRVAQLWAGNRWGHQFIPRIGMEVLVEFLDGDPDRPMVVGCVYNGLNRPPYTLPDKKTQSGIKSESTPHGGGSNELRFEDAKGREEVWLHAQKDFNERIEHSHSTSVGGSQTNTVGGSQTNTVSGSQTNTIKKDQTETITGQQTMTVEKNRIVSITGSQSVNIKGSEAADGVSGSKLNITGDYKLDASDKIDVQAPTHIELTCGGSSIRIEPDRIVLKAGGKAILVLDAKALLKANNGGTLSLDGYVLAKASDGGTLFLDSNVLTRAKEGAEVFLNANAAMTSNGGSQVKLDGSALVSGTETAKITAPNTSLEGGSDKMVAGSGLVRITGGLVKLN